MSRINIEESPDRLRITTAALEACVRLEGYVSGTERQTFRDRATGAADPGFGLHIMDFLMAPGWRDDEYRRDRVIHGNLPKHFVEGPQICTEAGRLDHVVRQTDEFLAITLRFEFTDPGEGYRAGSRWEQMLLFLPDTRYFLSSERITSANDVEELFYRIDMPGHVRHDRGDSFDRVYLSYHGLIEAAEFRSDFAPDERFLYRRDAASPPPRFIRAVQLRVNGKPGAWLAGMTLDPTIPAEAWCHQRGYVCFIQENHRRRVRRGEEFGAAYVIGYFDSVEQMEETYDSYKGAQGIEIHGDGFRLIGGCCE